MPRLLYQPKWFKNSEDLLEGDLVYFQKQDQAVGDAHWTLGMVEALERGKDGIVRSARIKYCNSGEQKLSLTKNAKNDDSTFPRYTERAVRKLIKIFSIDELNIAEELGKFQKIWEDWLEKEGQAAATQVAWIVPSNCQNNKKKYGCCCQSHCEISSHCRLDIVEFLAVEVRDVAMDSQGEDDNAGMELFDSAEVERALRV